jgi:hypothetical protein
MVRASAVREYYVRLSVAKSNIDACGWTPLYDVPNAQQRDNKAGYEPVPLTRDLQ